MTYRNVIGDAIEYFQGKTKEDRPVTVRVPLSKTAIALIEKYREEGAKVFSHSRRSSVITERLKRRSGSQD